MSTFRSLLGQPDDPIYYSGLMAPGGLAFLRFAEPKELDPRKAAEDTLRRGYKLGVGEVPQIPEYVLGSGAYNVLVKNLTEESFDENSYHGTAYTMACLMEAKGAIAEYLRKVDPIIEPRLVDIAETYKLYIRYYNGATRRSQWGPVRCLKGNASRWRVY